MQKRLTATYGPVRPGIVGNRTSRLLAHNRFGIRQKWFRNWAKVVSPPCLRDAVTWVFMVSRQRHKGGVGAKLMARNVIVFPYSMVVGVVV